jgi:hypothetical protein
MALVHDWRRWDATPGVVSVSRNGKRRYDPIWKERLIAAALNRGFRLQGSRWSMG